MKEGTSAILLQSGLEENWRADSEECYGYLRNVQDLLSDGNTPYERRFGELVGGPIFPFGSIVEYHPISVKDKARLHQFVQRKGPTRHLHWICVVFGGHLERRHFGQRSGAGRLGRDRNPCSETQRQGGSHAKERKKNSYFLFADGSVKFSNKISGIPNIHVNSATPCTRGGAPRCSSRRVGRVPAIRPTDGRH